MDWASHIDRIQPLWERLEAYAVAYPAIAAAGFILAAVAAVAGAVALLMGLVRVLQSLGRSGRVRQIRAGSDIGARIVVVSGRLGRPNAASRMLKRALQNHLKDFMFGGQFEIYSYPGDLADAETAAELLRKTEADLVVWTQPSSRKHPCEVGLVSRPPRAGEAASPPALLALPRKRTAWTPALEQAMVYACARHFRPALGRPQDFRPERLEPVVNTLLAVLSEEPAADETVIMQITDDATAGAVQLSQAGDETWSRMATQIARDTLEDIDRTRTPDRWILAKIALGRALRLRAERKFDPLALREAIAHLQDALEALRAEPRLKLGETAAQAIADAQRLLSGRRKFSITGGGI